MPAVTPRSAALRAERRQPGVRVLDVEDRVVVAALPEQVDVDVERRVRRGADQRVARRVDPHRLDQVFHCDDRARPLAHPHRLAVLDEVDHLPDQHLHHRRVVAERRRNGFQPSDVAVVVGAEHVDAQVEAAGALVEEVGDVARDVGGLAVRLDDRPVLVVAVLAGGEPPGAVVEIEFAGGLEPLDGRARPRRTRAATARGTTRRSRCRTRAAPP